MKKFILLILVTSFSLVSYSQCTPLPYQDSLYNIWPDTIQNLPAVTQGIPYSTALTIKTPSTLIEAAEGDSTRTRIDSTILGITINEYIGHWPVDSMELISLSGLPNGLSYGCEMYFPNCMLPGDSLTCAYLQGTTNASAGVYPIDILINVYTHGTIMLGFIPYSLSTDLYSALGSYEEVPGYKVVVNGGSSGIEMYNSNELVLLQNFPNPSNGNINIQFNTPSVQDIEFNIVDIFGRVLYTENISSTVGLNTIDVNQEFSSGIYIYSIHTEQNFLSRSMLVSE